MTTKPIFPALGAPMSPAWVHGSPRVEELALPKSLTGIPQMMGDWTLISAQLALFVNAGCPPPFTRPTA
jgi:hypothetical protein